MVTRAIVVSIDGLRATIRIPIYNKIEGVNGATPDTELYSAIVCVPNNTVSNLMPGDTVFVAFEESQIDKPVIIGHLPKSSILSNAGMDIGCKSLRVFGDTTFDGDIVIKLPEGRHHINKINLMSLEGWTDNIKTKFNAVDSELKNLNELVNKLKGRAESLHQTLGDLEGKVSNLQSNITLLSSRISTAETSMSQLQSDVGSLTSELSEVKSSFDKDIDIIMDSYLSRTSPILASSAYGTSFPSNPSTGQLFFKLNKA